jgi:hypothetical protein
MGPNNRTPIGRVHVVTLSRVRVSSAFSVSNLDPESL